MLVSGRALTSLRIRFRNTRNRVAILREIADNTNEQRERLFGRSLSREITRNVESPVTMDQFIDQLRRRDERAVGGEKRFLIQEIC